MKGNKTMFVCRECGATSLKWLGKCPDCMAWNTFDEIDVSPKSAKVSEKLGKTEPKSSPSFRCPSTYAHARV